MPGPGGINGSHPFKLTVESFNRPNNVAGGGARGTFTLCRMVEGDAEYAAFERTVASFVTALRLVRRELAEVGDSSPEPQPGLDRLTDGPFMQV